VDLSGFSSRRVITQFPWGALGLTLCISALGVWNLASAARTGHGAVWLPQLIWLGVGLAAALLLTVWDYRALMALAYPLYGLVLLLLVAVIFKGKVVMGARRWLELGPMVLQPSELAKVAVALAVARYFHEVPPPKGGYRVEQLAVPFALILIPVALVIRQPDLGTALIIAAIGFTLCLFAGIQRRTLAALCVLGLLGGAVGWSHFLKGYQRRRVETFLNPEGDALGAGYHANQSMIAVGSGLLLGKGWGHGTQTQFSFLPEQHTDFIFSVWAEEHGFLWSSAVLLLYFALLAWALGVAGGARERFGTFVATGVAALVFWQVFINIGMVTGLLPVVGVTLPLLSYGGSSLLSVLIGLGILYNIQMRRFSF
jgi:rod shape determining protein RodA